MAVPGKGGGINSIPVARFIRDMAILQATLPRRLAEQNEAQAGNVAKKARAMGRGMGGVHAKAAPGIKAVNQRPIIRLFGDDHPYIFGAEFGGGGRPTTKQFPPWRGKGASAGYMLFPTMRKETGGDDFIDDYFDVVKNAARFK